MQFQKLTRAYEILSDPVKRSVSDMVCIYLLFSISPLYRCTMDMEKEDWTSTRTVASLLIFFPIQCKIGRKKISSSFAIFSYTHLLNHITPACFLFCSASVISLRFPLSFFSFPFPFYLFF